MKVPVSCKGYAHGYTSNQTESMTFLRAIKSGVKRGLGSFFGFCSQTTIS